MYVGVEWRRRRRTSQATAGIQALIENASLKGLRRQMRARAEWGLAWGQNESQSTQVAGAPGRGAVPRVDLPFLRRWIYNLGLSWGAPSEHTGVRVTAYLDGAPDLFPRTRRSEI